MADEDRRVRAELVRDGSLFAGGYHARMEAVHRSNARRLVAIAERHGWPGRSLVGEEAARAAWLVLQHAIGEPEVQRRGLLWLRQAAARREVPDAEVAMLEDRVRVLEGRAQRYGTQLDIDENGELSPSPIEEEPHVDERRAAVGLPPLASTLEERRRTARAEGELGADGRVPGFSVAQWRSRQSQRDEWLRRVGWR